MYGSPYERSAERSKAGDSWVVDAQVDFGMLTGIRQAQYDLRQVQGRAQRPRARSLRRQADRAASGHLQAVGGGLGRHDAYFGLQTGRYNDWKVKFFYGELRHVYTDTYKRSSTAAAAAT
ncbi:MAG: hypothetical protein U1F49_13640 [Rubrivivax sp.]